MEHALSAPDAKDQVAMLLSGLSIAGRHPYIRRAGLSGYGDKQTM
jgi:hypothetical protein